MKKPIAELDNAYKDSNSGAIIFTDRSQYERAKARKMLYKKQEESTQIVRQIITENSELKKEVSELKEMVAKLIETRK